MDKKATGIVAYITWIGLLIAFLAGDKEGAKFHLNQSLVIWIGGVITGIIGYIPIIGWIISPILWIFLFVCAIIGIIGAVKEEEKEVPLIGGIKLLQ